MCEKMEFIDSTGGTGAMPQQKKGQLGRIVTASVLTLLALILFGARLHFAKQAERLQRGEVDIITALDRQAAPAESFVTTKGRIDKTNIGQVMGSHAGGAYDHLFTFEGEKHLLALCPYDASCMQEIRKAEGGTESTEGSFSGRLYDFNEYTGSHAGDMPGLALSQFAKQVGAEPTKARVIHLGESPGDIRRSATIALVFSVILGLLSVAAWVMTFKMRSKR